MRHTVRMDAAVQPVKVNANKVNTESMWLKLLEFREK